MNRFLIEFLIEFFFFFLLRAFFLFLSSGDKFQGPEEEEPTTMALQTVLYTLEDYFIDFQTRIRARSLVRLICLCYNQCVFSKNIDFSLSLYHEIYL